MEKNATFFYAALLLFLSFTPLLFSNDVILQYDDGDFEGAGARAGQAVRFTVPSGSYSCKIESLSVFVKEYNGNQTMKVSIWADDGGDLMSAVGDLLFEREMTVGEVLPVWYIVDLSDADIAIPPGGSFFGGWTSTADLWAFWDTSEPNDVTLQKYVNSPWLISPPNIDGPISATVSYVQPELIDVSPVSYTRGNRVSLVVDANNAEFSQGGICTIEDVWLSKNGANIYSTGFISTDSNSLTASFDLPVDANLGAWHVYIQSSLFGEMEPLAEAFTIYASPDLDRDGKIDIIDFNYFSNHWLEEFVSLDPNNLISGGDPGEDPAPLTGETDVLQYYNGVPGIWGTLVGQAVRFTIPPTGYSCKIESLSIYVEEFGNNNTMMASIWADEGGDLASAVGSLLSEEEVTGIGEATLHRIDLSDKDIIITPGESFFGGWTSEDYLMGYSAISEPNGKTVLKYDHSNWWEAPQNVDAPIQVEVSYLLPWINEISPVSGARGSQVTLVVDANDADFLLDEIDCVEDVWLFKDGFMIPSTDSFAIDNNSLSASFDIPGNAELGAWDVYVKSGLIGIGQLKPLAGAFTIFASPDIDRNGKVNINDFNFFSKHWEEDIVRLPVNVLVPGGVFYLGDKSLEDPSKITTIDEFSMSNFEISNQQYCYFLNSAISKGAIKVVSDIVYSSTDTSNTYPYFTCHGDFSESQIEYINGIFAVGGWKNRDAFYDPVVAVSWYGAAGYCNWRSVKEGKDACYDTAEWSCDLAKNGYRLPTEAEWEYAARGGLYDPYYRFGLGDTISHIDANYKASSQYDYDVSETDGFHADYGGATDIKPYTSPGGSFANNGFGLYDMVGNVWEWCNDWYSGSYYGLVEYDNPPGPAVGGNYKVMRGGGWNTNVYWCRTASRNSNVPGSMGGYTGFRVCCRP